MTEATTVLDKVITAEMLGGVLNEVIAVLPICIVPMITFIGLRKAISFVKGVLVSA